jgi:hypothetical protein
VAEVYKEMTGKDFPKRAAIERAYRSQAGYGVEAR